MMSSSPFQITSSGINSMKPASHADWILAGLTSGFGLWFLAFGLFWIGAHWALQLLLAVPFMLAAFLIRRYGHASYPVPVGMFPICSLIVQFRDNHGSYAYPIALGSASAVAVFLGIGLAKPNTRSSPP